MKQYYIYIYYHHVQNVGSIDSAKKPEKWISKKSKDKNMILLVSWSYMTFEIQLYKWLFLHLLPAREIEHKLNG